MPRKKEQSDTNRESIKRLKKRYAIWKKKHYLNERLEMEEYLINEPEELDLEIQH